MCRTRHRPALIDLVTWCMILPAIPAFSQQTPSNVCGQLTCQNGAIVRGPLTEKEIALVFTGDRFGDGLGHLDLLFNHYGVRASYFLTGNFYRDHRFASLIGGLRAQGHYLGAHSDRHLLYCDWENRDSLLVTHRQFRDDLEENYREMEQYGIEKGDAPYFLPPYEWYNDTISAWTREWGLQLINYTPGTLSHADYTVPGTAGYRSSNEILDSILAYEGSADDGLNGFLLLMHVGTEPERTDKFYLHVETLIDSLLVRGYRFVTVPELLGPLPPPSDSVIR